MQLFVFMALLSATAWAETPVLALPAEAEEDAIPGAGRRIPIGAYGEAFYLQASDAPDQAQLRRMVLFVGHRFDERWRVYSEIEIEHGDEVEMEQAFLEYRNCDCLGVRAGLLLMPVGIINVLHESPTFHGNERPLLDQAIVPTTWRELGAGLFGALGPLRYEAYVVRGLDASGFAADRPIRGGRLGGNEGRADSAAGVLHLGWSPLGGLDLGGSIYHGDASQGDDALDVGVTLAEVDARFSKSGLEGRAQFAHLSISGVDELAASRAGVPDTDAVPADSTSGLYLELGYDVLHAATSGHALVPFVRYERLDLGASDPTLVMQGGLTYRPHPQLAVKGDVSRIDPGTDPETRLALGVGFMF